MTFRVLSAHGRDLDDWRAMLEQFPPELRDLHYTPDYGLIYRDTYGHEPFLAVYQAHDQFVIQAFVRRRVSDEHFAADQDGGEVYDVATPYGFGGPLCSLQAGREATEALRAFDVAFRARCNDIGYASEFVCLHPLLDNHLLATTVPEFGARAEKQVVVVDLAAATETIESRISRGTWSSINRARREGVTVELTEPTPDILADFHTLYLETMERRGAAERWKFPPSYFPSCIARLGRHQTALLVARVEGHLAAAYLMIHDKQSAYYHFGASAAAYFHLRPNNLLMYSAITWAKTLGLRQMMLGGGVTAAPDDSLFRFKASFGGTARTLYTYGRVLHRPTYDRLVELKRAHERRTLGAELDSDYFPLYRRHGVPQPLQATPAS